MVTLFGGIFSLATKFCCHRRHTTGDIDQMQIQKQIADHLINHLFLKTKRESLLS